MQTLSKFSLALLSRWMVLSMQWPILTNPIVILLYIVGMRCPQPSALAAGCSTGIDSTVSGRKLGIVFFLSRARSGGRSTHPMLSWWPFHASNAVLEFHHLAWLAGLFGGHAHGRAPLSGVVHKRPLECSHGNISVQPLFHLDRSWPRMPQALALINFIKAFMERCGVRTQCDLDPFINFGNVDTDDSVR